MLTIVPIICIYTVWTESLLIILPFGVMVKEADILPLFKDSMPCFPVVTLVFDLGANIIHILQLSAASDILDFTSIL